MRSEHETDPVPQLSLNAKNGIQAELMIRWVAKSGENKMAWVDRYAGEVSPFLESNSRTRKLIMSGNPEDRIRAMEIIEEHLDDLDTVPASSSEAE